MFHFLSGLVDATLKGEPPQKIVVLGDSGAGKTTFVEQCKYLLSAQRLEDDKAFRHAVGRWQETSVVRRKARSETPEMVTLTTSSCDFPSHENPVLAKQSTIRPTVGLNVTKVVLSSSKRIGTRQPPPQQVVPLVLPQMRKRRKSNVPTVPTPPPTTVTSTPTAAKMTEESRSTKAHTQNGGGGLVIDTSIGGGGGASSTVSSVCLTPTMDIGGQRGGVGYTSPLRYGNSAVTKPTGDTSPNHTHHHRHSNGTLPHSHSLDTLPTNGSLVVVSDSTTPTSQQSNSGLHAVSTTQPLMADDDENHNRGTQTSRPSVDDFVETPKPTTSSARQASSVTIPHAPINCCDVDIWGSYRADHLITDPGPGEHTIVERPLILWDLGGQEHLRSLWVNYLKQCDGIIFLVDGRVKRRSVGTTVPPSASSFQDAVSKPSSSLNPSGNGSILPPLSPTTVPTNHPVTSDTAVSNHPASPEHLSRASELLRSILLHPALALIPVVIVGNKYDFLPSKAMPTGNDNDDDEDNDDWKLASISELQHHLRLLDILSDDSLPATSSHRPINVGVASALEGAGVLDILCWLSQSIHRQRASVSTSA